MENELDDIDYFFNDIEYCFLNNEAENFFENCEHIFIGISPFNKYFSKSTIHLLAKFCRKHSKKFTFFYVDELARYTLRIICPDYNEKQVQKKIKKESRFVKNKILESLYSLEYTNNDIKNLYKTFEDFKDNSFFKKAFEETYSVYKSEESGLKNLCNDFVSNIIKNNNIEIKITEEDRSFVHTYCLSELAVIKSVNAVLNTKNSLIIYHDIDFIKSFDFITKKILKSYNKIDFMYLKIKNQQNFLNQFIDDNVNIFVMDKNFRYRYVSKSLVENISFVKEKILNKTFYEIFNIKNEKIEQNDKRVLDGLTIETEEQELVNNTIKYFKVVKKPLKNQNNKTIGLIGFSTDITEIKEAQIKAEKDKEEELLFRENYLHELNNVEHKKEQIKIMLREFELDEEQKQTMVEILKFEEEKTSCLIKNFALHNSICEGKEIEILKKSTNIINLINREIEYYDLYYKYLNLDKIIIFENDFNNLELLIDEIKISQVIHNLVKNADKHSDAKKIIIKLSVLNNKVLILIKDDGVGINKEINKETLFIHDKNKKIIKSGNGLGLPICKSIIERHDGDICFKDIEVGTAIEFFLPFNLN